MREIKYGKSIFETLSQFIGLKDKNGEDIYEYDILKFDENEWGDEDGIFIVEFDENEAIFSTGGGTQEETKQYKSIIGNKFQNPELLEKVKNRG